MNLLQKYHSTKARILTILPKMPSTFNRLELAQSMGEKNHFFANGIPLDTFKELQSEGFIVNASPRTWSYVAPKNPEPTTVQVSKVQVSNTQTLEYRTSDVHICPTVPSLPKTPTEAMQALWDVIVTEVKKQEAEREQSEMARGFIVQLNEKDEIIETLTRRCADLADKLQGTHIPGLRLTV